MSSIAEQQRAPVNPHRDYFTQIIPEPCVILGRLLKPLSLGRFNLLRRFEVAFVADDSAQATPGDLLLGVLICSMRVDEFNEFSQSPDFSRQIRRWAKANNAIAPFENHPFLFRIWEHIFGKRWRERNSFNVIEKIQLFQRYIEDNSKCPRYWDESGSNGRASAAHWSHSLEVILRGQVGWTEDEINERPLNKAIQDFYKHMESQGLVRLMTADEIEMIDAPPNPEQLAALAEWAAALNAAGIGSAGPSDKTP